MYIIMDTLLVIYKKWIIYFCIYFKGAVYSSTSTAGAYNYYSISPSLRFWFCSFCSLKIPWKYISWDRSHSLSYSRLINASLNSIKSNLFSTFLPRLVYQNFLATLLYFYLVLMRFFFLYFLFPFISFITSPRLISIFGIFQNALVWGKDMRIPCRAHERIGGSRQ